MAQSSAFLTYDAAGNREDLMDVVTNISPIDTPMFSSFKKVKASATLVEWMTESLAAAAANTNIEGSDYSFSKPTARTRVTNNTQILRKTWEVSDTQEAVDKAGVESEYAHRMQNALKELGRDIEYALVNGTGNSGASGTARALKGVLAFITTNVETGSGTGTQALTESLFNDVLQTAYAAGGNPDTVYANGWQKRKISAFSTPSTRNIDAEDKKLVAAVDIYESDFGLLRIKLDRYMPTDKVALLEQDKWAVATLRPIKVDQNVARVGSARRAAVEAELTLVAYNEAASAQITELTTA